MLFRDQSRLIKINFLFKNLFQLSGGFNLVVFLAINSDVPLTRTEKLQPSNLVRNLFKISSYMVHFCMLSCEAVMARLNLESSSKFDNFKSAFLASDFEIGLFPYGVKRQWQCVRSVNKDKYSTNSEIKTKVNLISKFIFNLII